MASKAQSKKSPVLLVILLVLSLGLAILSIIFLFRKTKCLAKKKLISDPVKFYFLCLGEPISDNLAMMITAVALHETGNLKSSVYRNNNNAFGMRMPKKRKTTAIRDKNGYAYYNSVEDSIKDYLLWWGFHKKDPNEFMTVTDLVTGMKQRSYFEADLEKYRKAVQAHYNNVKRQWELYYAESINKPKAQSGRVEPL